ncbi:DinB family protein [Actinophytocola sp.]|uniref:DinB family protein n=1 Tax=Actinophytocola sp. TaxID=1872138 RepID=UPI002D806E91|nr:DinB family protein [Actinophytocola sp.]HET9141347.1 DinB family protein [Actinophytocola sp.]HEU5109385.1 DinB family protein [Micromonosporaceae bacterium]
MTIERPEPPYQGDDRAILTGFLDWQRATLAWKCDGVDQARLRERGVPPSNLSLLGLIRHMADVERGWFQRTLAGADAPRIYYSDEDPDGDFDHVETADIDEAFATWHAQCERSREIVAATPSLDTAAAGRDGRMISLRWILTHMIEEYARHNGHADLLRERIDGATGE